MRELLEVYVDYALGDTGDIVAWWDWRLNISRNHGVLWRTSSEMLMLLSQILGESDE